MYGSDGLVSFMYNLFALFDHEDMRDAVNYYPQMREQLEQMEAYERDRRKTTRDKIENISEEDSNEDEEEKIKMAFPEAKNSRGGSP
jgi:hypothetical protein